MKFLIFISLIALLTFSATGAVGSKVCADCHGAISLSYGKTPMANSSGVTGSGLFPLTLKNTSFQDKHAAFIYSAGQDQSGYFFEAKQQAQPQPETLRRYLPYFVGSGARASSFLLVNSGFLYEAPVTYYRQSQAWQLSPGYQNYSYPFLTRAVVPGCLQCHATGVQSVAGTQNGYATPPFQEGGIGCERCHGEGEAHVAEIKAGKHTSHAAIVNPAKLDPEKRDSVCAQCHLAGAVSVQRAGKNLQPFTPGASLQDYSVTFVRGNDLLRTKVTSHVENLAQSACKRSSGDQLWCGSCHDPHTVPAPAEKVAWYRSKCETCHGASGCTAPIAERQQKQNNCVACHMPSKPADDAEHTVFTDHSIPKQFTHSPKTELQANAPLVPFGQKEAPLRERALAYAILSLRERNAIYGEQAFQLLKLAERANPKDPEILAYLADLYKSRSDDKNALRLFQSLYQIDPQNLSAATALGAYAMEQGNHEEAIRFWTAALQRNPALLLVRVNLAVAFLRTNQPEAARATLQKALEFNPSFPAARDLLGKIKP